MKRVLGGVIGVTVAGVLSWLLHGFFVWKAAIALQLRPALAELGFWEALFSGHFNHWLYVVDPIAGFVFVALILCVITVPLALLFCD
jgi:hypothetical protein